MKTPKVTVLMAVYNGERFIREAVESILNQTYTDFELLIVDDASSDATQNIIQSFTDSRIKKIRNVSNLGVGCSRNIGLQIAKGEYVAILDADDIAYPDRLAEQVAFLTANPSIAQVGGAHDAIDENGNYLRTEYRPTVPYEIQWSLLFENLITTSSVMMKRDVAIDIGGFHQDLPTAEDFSLWGRMAILSLVAQLKKPIVKYRLTPGGLAQSNAKLGILQKNSIQVIQDNIKLLLNEEISLQVATLFHGSCRRPLKKDVEKAYVIFWKCLVKTIDKHKLDRYQTRRLFDRVLNYLLRLASQAEPERSYAFKIAIKFAVRYAPECLFKYSFFIFLMRIFVPQYIRQYFTHKSLITTNS